MPSRPATAWPWCWTSPSCSTTRTRRPRATPWCWRPCPTPCPSGDPMANSAPASTLEIRRLNRVDDAQLQSLADVLVDCVEGGASVSFMLPITRDRALAFWRKVADGVARGERILLVAEDPQGIAGTVQVIVDQPENQPHRADV